MINISAARKHFENTDPKLSELAKKFPIISTPKPIQNSHYSKELFNSIVSQQLSVKAAATIWDRFCDLVEDPNNPKLVKRFSIEQLRSVGLSRQKAGYILSIAEGVTDGTVKLDHLNELDDQSVIDELVQLKGVGRWTAEMFLIFTLARPDVFSVGDLGLRTAVKNLYERELSETDLLELSSVWSPHRSTACLFLWRSLDNKPKL